MNIVYKKLSEIKPYEKNPRKNDDAVKYVAESIKQFGFKVPIIIDKEGVIVAGHTRYKAATQLKMEEVPCIVADDLNPEQIRAFRLADNRVAEFSNWDLDVLFEELRELDDSFLLDDLGFKDFAYDEEEENKEYEDDFDVTPPEEPVSQLGDIYVLGKHRLMCGDSTKVEDVKKLCEDRKVGACFTDPPWNVDYGGTSHPSWRQRTILNDKMSTEDFNQFLTKAFISLKEVAKDGMMLYCVMSAQEWGNIMDVMSAQDYHWSSTIIWAKDSLVLSRKDYHTQYEPIWYGWYAGKNNAARLCPVEDRTQSDLWQIPRPKVSELHPTMKPVELVARALQNSSVKGKDEWVIDLFGGSGTTLIAAEETGRQCLMMELDPKYVDVIVNRYIHFTGSNEECYLIRDGQQLPLPDKFENPIL